MLMQVLAYLVPTLNLFTLLAHALTNHRCTNILHLSPGVRIQTHKTWAQPGTETRAHTKCVVCRLLSRLCARGGGGAPRVLGRQLPLPPPSP